MSQFIDTQTYTAQCPATESCIHTTNAQELLIQLFVRIASAGVNVHIQLRDHVGIHDSLPHAPCARKPWRGLGRSLPHDALAALTSERPSFWVAVKELNLSCHVMDIYQKVWFLDYGNLS